VLLPLVTFGALPTEAEVFAGAMSRFDRDGDGAISPEEYAVVADGTTPFSALDADGDGKVVVAEFAAWVKATDPRPMNGKVRPVEPPRQAAGGADAWAWGTGLGMALAAFGVIALGRYLRERIR
jgi:hypothetical protein